MIMPQFPFPPKGACEQGRISDMKRLKQRGADLRIITKIHAERMKDIPTVEQEMCIPITGIPYREKDYSFSSLLRRFTHPLLLDGAANEFDDPAILSEVEKQLKEYDPDVVWVEYTFLWPLNALIRKYNKPIVVRSHNREPLHFLQEDGRSLVNLFKYIIKNIGEKKSAREADVLLCINPQETEWYKSVGAKNAWLYPTRRLGFLTETPEHHITEKAQLHLLFMGSSYNIPHNRASAVFLLDEVMPRLEKQRPGFFHLHITGGKLPAALAEQAKKMDCVTYEGYVDDLDRFLARTIDIAAVPSLKGGGLQLKIFEPIARGIPTVTMRRGLVSFPFTEGEEVLTGSTADTFSDNILELQDGSRRAQLGARGREKAMSLFSHEALDKILDESFSQAGII